MVRIIRDYRELSKRQQVLVGIINCLLGAGVMFAIEGSVGIPAAITARNILITLAAGAAFLFVYGQIQKYRARKEIHAE